MAEGKYNYLDAYRRDVFAEKRMIRPIVFNEGNVCRVEPCEIVGWNRPDMAERSAKLGMPVIKVHVCCPTHGHFNMVMPDPPEDRHMLCDRCISAEMNRVFSLRVRRDEAYTKGQSLPDDDTEEEGGSWWQK